MMPFYDVCPLCGATLDPSEQCNCEKEKEEKSDDESNEGKKKANAYAA